MSDSCIVCTSSSPEIDTLKCLDGSLEVDDNFYYLEVISKGNCCFESVIARIRAGWKMFGQLLLLLTTKVFSFRVKSRLYDDCVRTVMLHGSEA
uniref:Uncharacterized protein n=1 Tax=Octopus bimaculoides TaxID=37653 RepID=A0A0L8GBN9_OCTBM